MNPFGLDVSEALAAHQRQPEGRVHVIEDDPETHEEIEAEKQRQRIARWHERRKQQRRAAHG